MQNTKEVLKLEDFNLSSRVLWLLARNNIDRAKLTSISYDELKAIPTMGNEKISEIKRELERKSFYNIVVPNMSSESRLVKQQYKESLLNEIKEFLLKNLSTSCDVNSIDDFIVDEVYTHMYRHVKLRDITNGLVHHTVEKTLDFITELI